MNAQKIDVMYFLNNFNLFKLRTHIFHIFIIK